MIVKNNSPQKYCYCGRFIYLAHCNAHKDTEYVIFFLVLDQISTSVKILLRTNVMMMLRALTPLAALTVFATKDLKGMVLLALVSIFFPLINMCINSKWSENASLVISLSAYERELRYLYCVCVCVCVPHFSILPYHAFRCQTSIYQQLQHGKFSKKAFSLDQKLKAL